MATNGTSLPHTIEGIVVEINAIKATIGQLAETVGALASTLNERGRVPWGVIFTGVAVAVTIVVAVGTLAYMPVKDAQQKSDSRRAALFFSQRYGWLLFCTCRGCGF
jgi:hypothetical protein